MDVLEVDYLEKDETMDESSTNRITRAQIIGGIAPYQNFEFYSTFGLTNLFIWEDLYYEDAHRMLLSL